MKLIEDLGMIYPNKDSKTKRRYAKYECPECLIHFISIKYDVDRGRTNKCKSCSSKTHGLVGHKLYNTWKNMKRRCLTKTNPSYKNYGGRGITIHDDFKDFSIWLKYVESLNGYGIEGNTMDRKDNDKDYTYGNLRWVSNNIQKRNTRPIRVNNKSGYRGVCWCNTKKKWKAYITVNSKRISLGYHAEALDGAKAYDKYVVDNNLEHNHNGTQHEAI